MFDQISKIIGDIGNVVASVTSRGTKGALAVEIVDTDGTPFASFGGAALITEAFDYIAITSRDTSDNPLTVEYRSGGSGGTLVATLTMTYDSSGNVDTVTKA